MRQIAIQRSHLFSRTRGVSTNPYDNPNPYQAGSAPNYAPPPQQGSPGLAIASMICGILSIPTCCCLLLNGPLSLAAVVMGGMVLANPNAGGKGMAVAGVITGGIGLLWLIFAIVINLMNPDLANQIQQMQQMQQQQP
jgi:hypothetical protein